MLELVDGFLGGVHRDLGHRQQAVGELGEDAGVEAVERAARTATVALVVEVAEQQSEAGVDHADVDAELGQTLVQEPGEHGGGAIDRELHAAVAPGASGDPAVGALLGRQGVPVDDRAEGAGGAAQHGLAVEAHPFLHQLTGKGGEELDGVTVDVDHRVVEPALHFVGGHPAHSHPPINARSSIRRVTIRQMAYDVVIRNGRVVDGSGFGSYRGDVGIVDGVIAASAGSASGATRRSTPRARS